LLASFSITLFAQQNSSLRKVLLFNETQTIVQDSLLIIPGSIRAYNSTNQVIADSLFWVSYKNQQLEFKTKAHYPIILYYRVLPHSVTKAFQETADTIPTLQSIKKREENEVYQIAPNANKDALFSTPGISKSGSITRGISMGNSQDVIVNSSLNLQMNGKLQDNLYIAAAISDNNIPIQPDGYSQQIREFDKVFIKIYNNNQSLQAGDIDIEKPEGYFMVLNRKVQGFNYQGDFKLNKNSTTTYKTQVAGASAKGKFSRNVIQGVEGNQGPYRLTGNQNETYVVILAGSEKVYIDGRKLTRGQDNDYVIDYNAAELTFTAKQLITKDSRIVAEFEYTDRAYARYMVLQTNEINTSTGNFWLNVFSENDSKNQPLDQTLDTSAKKFLSELGDNTQNALYPKTDSVSFNANEILYARIDTSINQQMFRFYRFSTNSNEAHYRLSFAYMGTGKGNYTKQQTLANGKIYKWIAPVDGILQGDYEPLGILVAPKKKQVISIGGNSKIGELNRVSGEISFSNNDQNTFSSLNDNNNIGAAFRVSADRTIRFADSSWTAYSNITTLHTQKNFDAIERFKSIEFERDWNIATNTTNNLAVAETNVSIGAGIKRNNQLLSDFNYNYLNRSNNYKASRITNNTRYNDSLNNLILTGSYLASTDELNKTNFARFDGTYSRSIKYISVGYKNDLEQNNWYKRSSDSLLSSSYSFYKNEFFIQTNDSTNHSARLGYSFRNDFQPINGKLLLATRANEYTSAIQLFKRSRQNIGLTLSYRTLKPMQKNDTINKNEGNLLARIDYSVRSADNFYTSSSYIELGSGLENKREYTYIEVAKGEGNYQWNDYNKNGLKELNEFEHAVFADQANYIKVFVATNQYVKAFTNGISHTSTLTPSRRFIDTTGWRSVLACFTDQIALRALNKNSNTNIWQQINPLLPFNNNTSLVSMNLQFRNEVGFLTPSGLTGCEYQFLHNRLRNLLVNGLDNQRNTSHELRYHQQLTENYRLTAKTNYSNKNYQSGYLTNRDYKLQLTGIQTAINWKNSENGTFQFSTLYNNKNNKLGAERSVEYNLELNYDYLLSQKGNLRLACNYININFKGNTYSAVAYEMMQGLLPGNNYTWTLNYLRSLRNGLELKLNYNGRITGGEKPIHTAGVELRANF
jgi:hypothetical protein